MITKKELRDKLAQAKSEADFERMYREEYKLLAANRLTTINKLSDRCVKLRENARHAQSAQIEAEEQLADMQGQLNRISAINESLTTKHLALATAEGDLAKAKRINEWMSEKPEPEPEQKHDTTETVLVEGVYYHLAWCGACRAFHLER